MKGTAGFVGDRVKDDSIWAVLHRECHALFPDELFADLFTTTGRRSVPPRIVATVMVLQRWFGLSDRDAVDAFEFDARWKYACGGLDFDYPGFVHTVLVDMRARLDRSERPKRIFEVTLDAARRAGVVSAKRVLDSTPLYDAVATQDTVTMIRSAIRQLLAAADPGLEAELRAVLVRDDDYRSGGKPICDWDDPAARERLVAELAADGFACLGVLDDRDLTEAVTQTAELLATVLGQDLEEGEGGRFRIARKVAKDRVISTVDPEARHGHKSRNRRFDGFKAHLSVDPDSELIDEVVVTPANTHDADAADDLLAGHADDEDKPKVMGDSAYAGPDTIAGLEDDGFEVIAKVPPATNRDGRHTKDDFSVDIDAGTVTCPAGQTVTIRFARDRSGRADFGEQCAGCPLRERCTSSPKGRSIRVHRQEALLQRVKAAQATPEWQHAYRSTRPKVERKIAHFVRAGWGARRARARGVNRVTTDAVTRAAAVNWARLATLGLDFTDGRWAAATS